MVNIETIKLSKEDEVFSEIEKLLNEEIHSTRGIYFRGQSDLKWPLSCRLDRFMRSTKSAVKMARLYERGLLDRVRMYSSAFPQFLGIDTADTAELTEILQHYGLPTRLLDWSKSPYIALFFAVSDYESETDFALYALEPSFFWRATPSIIEDQTASDDILPTKKVFQDGPDQVIRNLLENDSTYLENFKFIFPGSPAKKKNRRLMAQQGVFVLQGSTAKENFESNLEPYSTLPTFKNAITKYCIPRSLRRPILRKLDFMNIRPSNIFQDYTASLQDVLQELYVIDEKINQSETGMIE